ncbi:MAG TPA: CHC2 zinc finger domain-containing protein [Syntrophorhabdus sp.]|nr:CHC2 zinc finger domain-containing protein [Syntrophorhabdus sp.]
MDKEKVINSLPIRDFYDNELPGIKWNGKDGKVRCCFHEDKEPSLSINNATGFYKCFGCDASGDGLSSST